MMHTIVNYEWRHRRDGHGMIESYAVARFDSFCMISDLFSRKEQERIRLFWRNDIAEAIARAKTLIGRVITCGRFHVGALRGVKTDLVLLAESTGIISADSLLF